MQDLIDIQVVECLKHAVGLDEGIKNKNKESKNKERAGQAVRGPVLPAPDSPAL